MLVVQGCGCTGCSGILLRDINRIGEAKTQKMAIKSPIRNTYRTIYPIRSRFPQRCHSLIASSPDILPT